MRKGIRRFGTFSGVFTPTVLSIFGVILFLRSGWVVGNAGLWYAILILIISEVISITTALSISSISTNMRVGVGGIYYIISRSLGVEPGGAIGIPLFLSQAISVAFYVIGFTESIRWIFPHINPVILASVVLIIFTVIAYIGADFAIKVQYIILSILLLSILSFLIPGSFIPLKENLHHHFTESVNFWKVFAVFFPAVTGITAGVSMSGELKNPEKNIPYGTLIAIFFTGVFYLLVFIKLSSIAHHEELVRDTLILMKKSKIPILVFAGIWSATLSSALTFIVGAPRTLQSLAKDRVVPSVLAHTLGSKKEEPRMGIIVTYIIAQLFILGGTLNLVATVITMFFLITYTIINLSAGVSSIVGQPFYRPRFKVHYSISLIGGILNYSIMLMLSPPATAFATVSIVVIYGILGRRAIKQTWGDIRSGIWLSLARFSLLQLERMREDRKTWRPNLMVFSGNPETRTHLIRFANYLGRGNGIITLFNILEGDVEERADERFKKCEDLRRYIKLSGIPAFAEVEIVHTFHNDIHIVAQAHGIGKLSSNLALFGYPNSVDTGARLMEIVKRFVYLKKDILILRYDFENGYRDFKKIDIWWGGRGGNDSLMLFIAYILRLNRDWQGSRIRILRAVRDNLNLNKVESGMKYMLHRARVKGDVEVVSLEGGNLKEALEERSRDAALVIMGMPIPDEGRRTMDRINSIIPEKGSVLLVRSTEIKSLFE